MPIRSQGVLPVTATAHRVGSSAIGYVCGKLHDRDERQAPGGFSGVAALEIEGLERGMIINAPQSIPHLHKTGAVGKGGPCDTFSIFRDDIERLGGKGHTTFLPSHRTYYIETRCILPAASHRPP
jgi:hypothetical protein